jgi:hypothetical protein
MLVPAGRRLRSTIDVDRLPGDVARHVGGEEYSGTGDLVDMLEMTHRDNIMPEYDAPLAYRAGKTWAQLQTSHMMSCDAKQQLNASPKRGSAARPTDHKM